MTSVGEVMSIGRTFEEAIQKAVRMVSGGVLEGLDGIASMPEGHELDELLRVPTDKRCVRKHDELIYPSIAHLINLTASCC
jgi:hypothetical protein